MCLGWGFSRGDTVEGRASALPKSSLVCSSWQSRAIFTPALSPTARAGEASDAIPISDGASCMDPVTLWLSQTSSLVIWAV